MQSTQGGVSEVSVNVVNGNCAGVDHVTIAILPAETTGDLQFKWEGKNSSEVAVPPPGDLSPPEIYRVRVSGSGSTKFRAVLTNCDGQSCASQDVEVDPLFAETGTVRY